MRKAKKPYYLFLRGGRWYYRLPNEKTFHSTGQKDRDRAIDEIHRQTGLGRPGMLLEDYAKNFFVWNKCSWIKRQHAKDRSFSKPVARSRRSHLEKYIFPVFGNTDLTNLNAVEIENWIVSLDLSNQTKNHIIYTLNIILKEAKREKLITANPLDDVEPMAKKYKERDTFTVEELKRLFPRDRRKLLTVWGDIYYSTYFMLLATTGMRVSEARALQWGDVLWEIGGILILRAVKEDRTIGEPKAKERRGILLPELTVKTLKWWNSKTPLTETDDFIFPGANPEKPITKESISRHFKPAFRRAGIDTSNRNIVIHSFRHTYNSIMRGILPERTLREFTGHRSEQMTERYDHPELETRLRQLLPAQEILNDAWNS